MALFCRRSERESEPDPAFTFMRAADARQVRSLVREAFAEHGLEVNVFADHVLDASERQFGLWNVMAFCHNDERGRTAWPAVVRGHVRKILTSMEADKFGSLTSEEASGEPRCGSTRRPASPISARTPPASSRPV
jgi:hypothetical protein